MAEAYQCDICMQFYPNTGKNKRIIMRTIPNGHDKFLDICPDCLESFQWWMGTRHPKHKTALAKPDSGCGWVD